jgi:hypothetical protein
VDDHRGALRTPERAGRRAHQKNCIRSWHATLVRRTVEVTTTKSSKERQSIMKNCIRYICSALVVAGTLAASFALAEEKSASEKLDPKMEEMMKKAEAAGTPGAAHKALEPLVGEWTAEVKSWMAPDAPPTVSKATAKASWAFNGRFVREEFNGEMMGKPFHGMSLIGYDNQKQKYNSVWVDDMRGAFPFSRSCCQKREMGISHLFQHVPASGFVEGAEHEYFLGIFLVPKDTRSFEA